MSIRYKLPALMSKHDQMQNFSDWCGAPTQLAIGVISTAAPYLYTALGIYWLSVGNLVVGNLVSTDVG